MLNFLCTLLKVYLPACSSHIVLLLGGSPPLSMYALEGAVEFPPASGLFCCICVVYVLYMVHSVYVSMCFCVPE